MANQDSADVIRQRMAELRRELSYDVRDVGRSARAMTNLSFYVRQFPWATMAAAVAAGYILVPKKREVVYPDPHTLADLVKHQQVRIDASAAAKESQSVLRTLLVMGLTWAARTGLNYVGQQLAATTLHKGSSSSARAGQSSPTRH
ncbi:MAG TPA: hypothetical protein VFW73_13280 [Lacipirellulaceae bacterium]|nr:hypothetical protein [Lacipirellulaceae bacterium]